MNEELQKQLAMLLAKLSDAAGQATDWSVAQAYPLIQEKILLGRIEATLDILIGVALLVGLCGTYKLLQFCVRKADTAKYENVDRWLAAIIFSVLGVIFQFIVGIALVLNYHNFLLVWFAPRLYIVEWLTSVVK